MNIIEKLINIFPIVFYPFLNIIILFLLGFGLTILILPKSLRTFWLWLSPWVTVITSIFYFVVTSLFGFPMKQTFILYIAVCLLANIYVLIKKKSNIKINKIEDIVLVILVTITLVFNLSSLIRRDKTLTSISMGNNDIISYVATGDYLKNHSIKESFKSRVDQSIGTLLQGGYRWGTPIINSFFLTLLNLDGYKYTYVSQVVLFSIMIPLPYILFQILFKSNLFGLISVSFFTSFNVNLLYMLYHNFFGQVLFWGIEMLLFIFLYSYFKSQEITKMKPNSYDFILGILITVLYFSYHEPAIFLFAPLVFFLILIFYLKKVLLKNYIFALFKITLVTLITGSTSIFHAFVVDYKQAFVVNSNDPIGWQLFRNKIPYANPFEAMGFWSIHNFEPLHIFLAGTLSGLIILVFINGLLKSRFKILTICYLFFFFFVCYWFGINKRNFFAYNRALTYTLPFFIVLFSIGLTNLYEKQKNFWSIILVVLISLELWSAINLNKRFIREHLSVEKSFISILDIKNKKDPIYSEVFIEEATPLWKQIWIGYFLYTKNISPIPTNVNYDSYENKVPDNSLVLISKPNQWLDSLKIVYKDIIWSNDYYNLGHICNADDCLLKSEYGLNEIRIGNNEFEDSLLINGWNITEGDVRWANEKESTLRMVIRDIVSPTSLTIEALSLKKPQEIVVYIDDELIGNISIDTEWKDYSLPINYQLNPGVHKIKFTYSNGYRPMDVIPGNVDSRTLYVNFKKIKLE